MNATTPSRSQKRCFGGFESQHLVIRDPNEENLSAIVDIRSRMPHAQISRLCKHQSYRERWGHRASLNASVNSLSIVELNQSISCLMLTDSNKTRFLAFDLILGEYFLWRYQAAQTRESKQIMNSSEKWQFVEVIETFPFWKTFAKNVLSKSECLPWQLESEKQML